VGSGQWAVGSGQWAVEKAQSSGKRNADPSRVGELFVGAMIKGWRPEFIGTYPGLLSRAATPL
jgi:hypothetical protein